MATKNANQDPNKTIVFRAVKNTVKLVIEGETLSRKIEDAEERKLLKERVVAYNAKPLVKEKNALKKLMNTDKVEAKKEKATAVKAQPKPTKKVAEVIEKEPELTKEQQIEQAKALLTKEGFTVNAKSTPSTKRYRGEY